MNIRFVLHELREAMRATGADIVFLQEVLGEHQTKQKKYEEWPDGSQYEFLADSIWSDYAYGKNAAYPEGHHGNAILSKYPITSFKNIDVSAHPVDPRGILHCEIRLPLDDMRLHCLCVHFGLLKTFRQHQVSLLVDRIKQYASEGPVIVAEDFNDWQLHADLHLEEELQLMETHKAVCGKHARTYPSFLPVFRMDRIYQKGFDIQETKILRESIWSKLSDHLPLLSQLKIQVG